MTSVTPTPVGAWQVSVSGEDAPRPTLLIAFGSDGVVTFQSSAEEGLSGLGSWKWEAGHDFTATLRAIAEDASAALDGEEDDESEIVELFYEYRLRLSLKGDDRFEGEADLTASYADGEELDDEADPGLKIVGARF
ncbi:hypothetical protein Afil01_51150 [Actinorhabdospora filicis]|uniref:Uncharacterized protein n=1 Tax=Actinorhabdospora filicis TaxID=1785913 RepID=A0A9W6SQK8_9ACTN|nr:hypothetical protein [Actinorhabdospora filicis]GLZ80308.1 hypothetical protein Afil01_51150 [Actinorhabdospora filicis]